MTQIPHPEWNYAASRRIVVCVKKEKSDACQLCCSIMGMLQGDNKGQMWSLKFVPFFLHRHQLGRGGRDRKQGGSTCFFVFIEGGMEGGISHFATADRRKEREKEENKKECCFLFSPLIKSRCQGTILWACSTQHNCFLTCFLGSSALVEKPFRFSSSNPLDFLQF